MSQAATVLPQRTPPPTQQMEIINVGDDILLDMLFDFHTKSVISEVEKTSKQND